MRWYRGLLSIISQVDGLASSYLTSTRSGRQSNKRGQRVHEHELSLVLEEAWNRGSVGNSQQGVPGSELRAGEKIDTQTL